MMKKKGKKKEIFVVLAPSKNVKIKIARILKFTAI